MQWHGGDLASVGDLAAIDVLRAGGNAADAAVTACAVLCVVEPHMTGIGGDCFVMLSQPGKPAWGYNGSGRAGAKASAEALRRQGMREIGTSIHAVTVPGAVDAWEATPQGAWHASASIARLAPAIKYAEGGFPVAARVAWDWARYVAGSRPIPARPNIICSTARRRRKATSSGFPALAAR